MLQSPSLHRVSIRDAFWSRRLEINHTVTIPAIYEKCRQTGRIDAWKLNWRPGMPNEPHMFWDSDVAKWIEAAAYSLIAFPDAALQRKVDEVVALILRAQQPDGYINTHFTVVRPQMRWKNLRDWHELYCAGHLIEAAMAYHEATGASEFLQAVCRYADHIASVFGPEPGQKRGYPGHEEIELALIKLYRATGERKYLNLAKFFVDERGRQPHYFDVEAKERGEDPQAYWAGTHEYTQSHVPVREQDRPVGHAVRAMYLYSAMTDLALEYRDEGLLTACNRIWRHLVQKSMYITGGIGSLAANEGFADDYELPNDSAYAETCAAIGLFFWAHRMLHVHRHAHYADIMERTLYNAILSGVSLGGDLFFYQNPLASSGDHRRQPWFTCACCPPNLARLLASLGRYLHSFGERDIFLHLYIGNETVFSISEAEVRIETVSALPWQERVEITIFPEKPASFALYLRLPDWCPAPGIELNGRSVTRQAGIENRYAKLERNWRAGDRIVLTLPMPVRQIEAHPKVKANAGRIALQRGPLIYCFEEVDNGPNLHDLTLCREAAIRAQYKSDCLGGVVVLQGKAVRRCLEAWEDHLYAPAPTPREDMTFTAVPYYAWANRDPGEMRVWML